MSAHGLAVHKIFETSAGSSLPSNAELAALLHADRGADRVTAIVTYELGFWAYQVARATCRRWGCGFRRMFQLIARGRPVSFPPDLAGDVRHHLQPLPDGRMPPG